MEPLSYTDTDRQLWEEELEEFVPERVFDAHAHLWSHAHMDPAEVDTSMLEVDLEGTEHWDGIFLPRRKVDYLILGHPKLGVDVRAHNRWVAEEMAARPNSRRHYLVTPDSDIDVITKEVDELGYTGLKPYRIYATTGDANNCRIHEFLTHEQMELANERGLWVTMHLSRSDGCGDEHNLADLKEYTTKRYPRIKWILAHCARSFTYYPLQLGVERLRDMPNIWYDTSAVTDVMAQYTLVKEEDHRRVMYGSDNMVANAFHGHYVAMGRFWYQVSSPPVAEKAQIHTTHRPVISIYQQLLCQLHAYRLAELERSQIEDIFFNNAAEAFGLDRDA